MANSYVVYVHIFPDGKKYVGCTINAKHRWDNGFGYTKNKDMFDAILFHGWNNIEHNILYRNLSEEEAHRIESELIIQLKTYDKAFGYNRSQGSVQGVKHHSAEGIENIRIAMSTRIVSEESREKMRTAKLGKAYHTKKHTEETKALISQSRKGKTAKENHPMARPVKCVETGIIYPYAKAAEEATGIGRAHICQVCKGQRKRAGGFHWEYVQKEA